MTKAELQAAIDARLTEARQELIDKGIDPDIANYIGVEITRAGVRLTVPRTAVDRLTAELGELPAYLHIVEVS